MSIPLRDSLLVPFSTNFDTRINASATTFGLTTAQATAYTALHTPYVAAYNAMMAARADGTRSKSLTNIKNQKKADLLAYARELYAFVQNNTAVADADKILLGVHVRSGSPTPIPPPTTQPTMDVVSVIARTVKVNIYDNSSRTKRSKAPGALGAKVYTFVGATYPSDPTAWAYQGDATKTVYSVTFPDTVANGAQIWVCAAWYNRKGETGPSSVPVSTFIQGGLQMAA